MGLATFLLTAFEVDDFVTIANKDALDVLGADGVEVEDDEGTEVLDIAAAALTILVLEAGAVDTVPVGPFKFCDIFPVELDMLGPGLEVAYEFFTRVLVGFLVAAPTDLVVMPANVNADAGERFTFVTDGLLDTLAAVLTDGRDGKAVFSVEGPEVPTPLSTIKGLEH